MRRFIDPAGRLWDVVVGRESFGALYAIFAPAAGNPGPNRQTILGAVSHGQAEAELDALSDEALMALFERSEPKDLG